MAFEPFEVTFSNYRSFETRTTLRIEPGVTAIVGPNNAGKSNVLRLIYELRPLFEAFSAPAGQNPSLPTFFNGGSGITPVLNSPFNNVEDTEAVFPASGEGELSIELRTRAKPPQWQNKMFIHPPDALRVTISRDKRVGVAVRHEDMYTSASQYARHQDGYVRSSASSNAFIFDLTDYVTAFSILRDSIYIGSFRNLLNQGSNENYLDLVIGSALVSRWRSLQTGPHRKSNLAAIATVQELRRIFKFNSLELIANESGSNIKAIVDGKPFLLSELGSGVSQFFIILMNLELTTRRIALIDEPELGLHPQLQHELLTSVAQRSETVIFTTHSLGLARNTANNVLTASRVGPNACSILRPFNAMHNPIELLGELSFSGNHDLGYNTILLVEGPTEVRLIRSILRALGRPQDLTILSLGGSSSISRKHAHALIEIRRLSDNIFALVDSERVDASTRAIPERLEFERTCRRIGIKCHLTELRSVECYFPDAAVKATLGSDFSALGPYDKVPESWPKALNWKIMENATAMTLNAPDLVAFIDGIAKSQTP